MPPEDRCVLDASVAIALVLPDEERGESARRLVAWLGDGQVVVPGHWRAEIGNALLMAIRHGRLTTDTLPRPLADLAALPQRVDRVGTDAPWEAPMVAALSTGLTLYDAIYLELSQRLGLPLASFDAALCRAARAAGVMVLP